MDHSRPDQNAEKGTPLDLRRLTTVLAAGFFSTTLAQPEVIELPLQGLLKEVLHLSVTQMSLFFSIGALAWYCKPFVGIIADSYPLLGTHRLSYIVLGAVIAAACWLAAGVAPLRYTFLLGIVVMINAGLVIASTAVGGLLVEVSRRYDASDRLVPMRSVVTRACLLVGGPLGGFLATFAFGLSTTICAVVALLVVPIAMIWLHERAAPKELVAGMAKCEAPDRGSSSLAQRLGLRSTRVPSARGAGFSRQATLLLPHRRAAFFAKFDRLAQGCRGCSRLCCCVHILSRTSAMQSGMANRPQHSAQCCWCTRIPVVCIACQRGFHRCCGRLLGHNFGFGPHGNCRKKLAVGERGIHVVPSSKCL